MTPIHAPHDLARQAGSLGTFATLNQDTLVKVLQAALPARVLASLASSSRQLCTLARSGVPVGLHIRNTAQAQLVLLSHARGGPPFSGCTELHLAADDASHPLTAAGVISTVQHWTSLKTLGLTFSYGAVPLGESMDFCVSNLLSMIPAIKQLRSLQLTVVTLAPGGASAISSLVQLTHLQLTASETTAAATGTRVHIGSWSRLTNLKRLDVVCAPAVVPAQGAAGPFSLPSSVTHLSLNFGSESRPGPLACWVTHLPGCPQLQEVEWVYGPQQHASTHPGALVRSLAQHNTRVRVMRYQTYNNVLPVWGQGAAVAGLPDAAAPVEGEWRPGPALAALTGLEVLDGGRLLHVTNGLDWQHLVQLTALTSLAAAVFCYTPPASAGATLGVLDLQNCRVQLGGHGLARLLLACPQLHTASVAIATPLVLTPVNPSEPQLQPHASLRALQVSDCYLWSQAGAAAAVAAAAAAAGPATRPPPQATTTTAAAAAAAASGATAHFAALAPVLKGVSSLTLYYWPACSSSSSTAVATLPDLSPCTALTKLVFGCHEGTPDHAHPGQEQFLSMCSTLVQLQHVVLFHAPRVNARVALALQPVLPRLQLIQLVGCGKEVPLTSAGSQQQQQRKPKQQQKQQQQALNKVKQRLRRGLTLAVYR